MKISTLAFATALIASQQQASGSITQDWMEKQKVEQKDAAGTLITDYGTIRGETSWKRGGWGANENMDLIFTLITEVPDANGYNTSLFDSYIFKIAFW